jgi:peptide/nickel transport system substrate-binding protein
MRTDQLLEAVATRRISRRQFVNQALAAGMSAPAIAAALAASERSALAAGEAKTGAATTLIVANAATPSGVDLDFHISPATSDIMGNTLDQLIGFTTITNGDGLPDLDLNSVEGRLAEGWTISPDGLTVTFHLKKGVTSAYGNELTADDVKWKWDRGYALKGVGAFYYPILKIRDNNSIKVLDKYTVSFTSEAVSTSALVLHSNLYVSIPDSTEARKHSTSDDPWATKWMATNAPGFGAYKVASWEAGHQVVLTANPKYWGGLPKMQKVIYREVPSDANRVALLQSGDIDIAFQLSPRQREQLKSDPNVRVDYWKSTTVMFLGMNDGIAPFDDARVRQAINYALPHDDILNTVWFGQARQLKSSVPDIFPGWTGEFWHYQTDLDKAKKLLADAGKPDGFKTSISYDAGLAGVEDMAVLIQTSLQQIGIEVVLNKIPSANFFERVQRHDFPMFIMRDQVNVPDPGFALFLYMHPKSFVNYTNYINSDLANLIDASIGELDATKRGQYYRQAQQHVVEQAVWGFLVQPPYAAAHRAQVKNLHWYLSDFMRWNLTEKT